MRLRLFSIGVLWLSLITGCGPSKPQAAAPPAVAPPVAPPVTTPVAPPVTPPITTVVTPPITSPLAPPTTSPALPPTPAITEGSEVTAQALAKAAFPPAEKPATDPPAGAKLKIRCEVDNAVRVNNQLRVYALSEYQPRPREKAARVEIQLDFPDTSIQDKISRGQVLLVEGTYQGLKDFQISFSDCNLVKVESEPQQVPADAFVEQALKLGDQDMRKAHQTSPGLYDSPKDSVILLEAEIVKATPRLVTLKSTNPKGLTAMFPPSQDGSQLKPGQVAVISCRYMATIDGQIQVQQCRIARIVKNM